MSDLRHLLVRFAEEGEQRGATAVLDAAATIVAHRRKRRRIRRMAATLAALTVAIGGAAVIIVRSGNHERGLIVTTPTPEPTATPSTTTPTDSLAPVPAPEKPREQIQVPLDRTGAPLTAGNGRIWVGGASGVEAFDPLTLHQFGTVPTALPVLELASSSNGLWVLSGRDFNLDAQRNPRYRLERIDPLTLKVQLAMDLPFAVGYHSSWHIRLAAASSTAWVALGPSVLRIDARGRAAVEVGPTGQSVGNIAADSTGLWIIADNAPLLQHIDAATNAVTTIRGLPDGFYWSIAATTDAIWLVASVDAGPGLRLMRVDAASHAIATYRIPGVALVADSGQLWVQVIDPHGHSLNFDNLVAQIDTRNGRLLRAVKIAIGEEPGSSGNGYASLPFVVTGDQIWSAYNGLQRTTLDRSASVPTAHPSATAPAFVESAVVAGAPDGRPPCASGVTGDYWGDAAHPERAPLRREATFTSGRRWALCGASVAFSSELLNLRSNNGGATWDVSVTPMTFAPHNAGDDLEIALTSETAGRVTFTSLVAHELNASFETHDGGRTWTKA